MTTPRAAAVAGIVFSLLFGACVVLFRTAIPQDVVASTGWAQRGAGRVTAAAVLMPFAGIAFLWFIGVIREQLGDVEDRLFSTVFLGSGLLFLAMLFVGSITSNSLLDMLERPSFDNNLWDYGRDNAQNLFSIYAMRMAAVFTLSVSTVGMRAAAMPRWVSFLGYLVALLLLVASSAQPWLQLAFPGWVLLVSLVILTRSTRPVARDTPDG